MRFLYNNLAAIYVALVAALMAWIYGGTMSMPLVQVVPWLMLFMVEIIFIFPQHHKGESTYEARERTWESMKKDPLVWTAVVFIVMLIVPFLNNGLCVTCDRALIAQGIRPDPPVSFLPFCVDRMDHLNVFLWFVMALSCMIATKHCLVKEGKRLMLELLAWNGAALAVFGFIEAVAGAPGPLWAKPPDGTAASGFFSTWGYVNMAGDYFTTMFGVSIALWRWHYDEERNLALEISSQSRAKPRDLFWKQNLFLVPAVLCFIAAMNTLSRSAIMMSSALLFLYFLHTFRSFTARLSRARRVKATVVCGVVLVFLALLAVAYMPTGIKKEMKSVDTSEVLNRVTGKTENHVTYATEIWREHPLFGCGGWGYRHFVYGKMDAKDVEQMKKHGAGPGFANVHNDYMQFLAEHGLVGLLMFISLVILLLAPLYRTWRVLLRVTRFAAAKDRPPSPVQIFVIPAPVFCILLTTVATAIHAFADCPFRSAAILTLFFVLLAAIDGFMPKEIGHHQQSEPKEHHHRHVHS